MRTTVGEELMRTHKNYQPTLARIESGRLKALAHITGGGLIDNIPRVLPANCDAVIEARSWKIPAIFSVLQRDGRIDREEMFQVFNMGIGMVAIASRGDAAPLARRLRARVVGRIERGRGKTRLVF
jgi:phosphoribosylformylglycinamidine cyclo-ligase